MSIGFEIIHESTVILRHMTVYKQAKAYKYGGSIYANCMGGFVRLKNNGGTSHPNVTWIEAEGVSIKKPKPMSGGDVEVKSG